MKIPKKDYISIICLQILKMKLLEYLSFRTSDMQHFLVLVKLISTWQSLKIIILLIVEV